MESYPQNGTITTRISDTHFMYQLQDNHYTVIWAPILFATVIALSLVGILVPLWEFLFESRKGLRCKEMSIVSLFNDGAEHEHVSEISQDLKLELARMLDRTTKKKGWRDLAGELGYQYEIKGKAAALTLDTISEYYHVVSPTISLLNRWQFTNTATLENLLKSLYTIDRPDCANILEAQYNLIVLECLTTV